MSARYDPVIRLHHTGRTIMARFKYDTNLQHLARWVGSTCHDGLLASEVWGIDWRAPRGAEHPETHPHTRDAVVYAECSSRTLAPGLQLCKECNCTALRGPCGGRGEMAVFEDPCLEPGFELPTDAGGDPCFGQEACMIDAVEAFRDVNFQRILRPKPDRVEDGFDGHPSRNVLGESHRYAATAWPPIRVPMLGARASAAPFPVGRNTHSTLHLYPSRLWNP